ncbi:SbcC/MukB-like Walker B domain-containing protein, partial [Aquipuribacter sp. SD81]|uniref:SbcC/MukB-like Walker B domain-containing protein n=1 Tax=Aquipuribacter sp. SD81 TaxID=3127703 RepID=UPI003015A68F
PADAALAAGLPRDVEEALRAHVRAGRSRAEQRTAAAGTARRRLDAATRLVEALEAEREAVAGAVERATGDLERARAETSGEQQELDRLTRTLAEALAADDGATDDGAGGRLDSRLDRAAAAAREGERTATALLRSTRELVQARQEAEQQAERTRAAALEAGFADPAAALAAARTPAALAEARRRVAAHDEERSAVAGRLEAVEAGLTGLPPDLPRDVDGAEVHLADTEHLLADAVEAHRGAARDLVLAERSLEGLARAVPRLVAHERALDPLREAARDARALADLCAGDNDRGIPLSTYVLAAHLEQVVSAANGRLERMSEGRYTLVHVDEGEDRRRRAGLGLAVLDAWTGAQRPAGTLSGGETFLASLALALGLADVVTAEAGGTRIDALFVDEGFGTLDPEALDRAMDVLDGLQEHGRVVGLVSHVEELRRRVPRQLHVRRERHGSTVVVDLAGETAPPAVGAG